MMDAAVQLQNVQFSWPGPSRFGISVGDFAVAPGEKVLLLGPSGSGKSTLLSLLAGIVSPQQGSIAISGTDISAMRAHARDRFRADHIGLIFQSLNLVPYLSTLDNVVLPLGFAPRRRKRVREGGGEQVVASAILDRLGLPSASFGDMTARMLSVGQQQRVAVARALIGMPDVVIADEPTSALDADHRNGFLDLLGEQLQGTDTALIMVSHDRSLTAFFDRSVELDQIARTERGR